MNPPIGSVAELQGLYGSFSFSENLLQKIWLRGDFDRSRALTAEGQKIEIVHPGRWNRMGGPDFLGARLRFGGAAEVTGDIELHLHEEDWAAHRHASDPAYDRVRLHVVLFSGRQASGTKGANGRDIPILVLLPLLHHDLEEFAADEAIARMAARPAGQIFDALSLMLPPDLDGCLRAAAGLRWRQKVHFARLRVRRFGWTAACHHTALEILGYRYNRTPMLRIAGQFPIEVWCSKENRTDEMLGVENGNWSLQGVRPANHPRTRLEQYRRWVGACPDWPERMKAWAERWPRVSAEEKTRQVRADHDFAGIRKRVAEDICGAAIGGSRLDTFVTDGVLPLIAADGADDGVMFGGWFHWFPGDFPPVVGRTLRDLSVVGVAAGQSAASGYAQGLLGWSWQREAGASVAG